MELCETKQTGSHIQLLPNILFLKFTQAAFETLEEKQILAGPDVGQQDRKSAHLRWVTARGSTYLLSLLPVTSMFGGLFRRLTHVKSPIELPIFFRH